MQNINAQNLYQQLKNEENILLIDVREPHEHQQYNIGGKLIPMSTVMQNTGEIPNDRPVIFYCQKGIRSAIVIQRLQEKFGYNNLLNLTGGIEAWQKQYPGPFVL